VFSPQKDANTSGFSTHTFNPISASSSRYLAAKRKEHLLKVPSGQIGITRECYHWIGLKTTINRFRILQTLIRTSRRRDSFFIKRLRTLKSFQIFKSKIKKSKTCSGWCPFHGLSNVTILIQIQSGRTVPLMPYNGISSAFEIFVGGFWCRMRTDTSNPHQVTAAPNADSTFFFFMIQHKYIQ
jgi:hypothetical protein